jgi:hypothetical protein
MSIQRRKTGSTLSVDFMSEKCVYRHYIGLVRDIHILNNINEQVLILLERESNASCN